MTIWTAVLSGCENSDSSTRLVVLGLRSSSSHLPGLEDDYKETGGNIELGLVLILTLPRRVHFGASSSFDRASSMKSMSFEADGKLDKRSAAIIGHWAPCPVNTYTSIGNALGTLLVGEKAGGLAPSVTAKDRYTRCSRRAPSV